MNSQKDSVSIIIPLYKVELYIEECVRSVIAQTYPHLHVVLVDDCGGDASLSIAESLLRASHVSWSSISHEKNRGAGAARNSGLATISSEYFFFLDGDDIIAPDCIELLVAKAKQSGAVMVYGNYMNLIDGKIEAGFGTRVSGDYLEFDPVRAYMNGGASSIDCNRLLSSEWYHATGVRFLEGCVREDEIWSLALSVRCPKIEYVENITYYYRQRPGSVMTSPANETLRLEAQLLRLHEAQKEAEMFPKKVPSDFYLWHNTLLRQTLAQIRGSSVNRIKWAKRALACAWLPSSATISSIPYPELRFFYRFRTVLSDYWSYFIGCKLMGMRRK